MKHILETNATKNNVNTFLKTIPIPALLIRVEKQRSIHLERMTKKTYKVLSTMKARA